MSESKLENTKPIDPNDPNQRDVNNFNSLKHTTLAGMLQSREAGSSIKLMAAAAGHPMLNFPSAEEEMAKQELQKLRNVETEKKMKTPRNIEVGHIYRHKVRGTKMTVIQASVGITGSGEELHLCIESKTGKKIKALDSLLQR